MDLDLDTTTWKEFKDQFQENGFAVIPGFWSQNEVEECKIATENLIDIYCQDMPPSVFSAASSEENKNSKPRDTWFAESGDKIRGFYEEGAVDENGQLKGDIKCSEALNKIGHALHSLNPTFQKMTISQKVAKVVNQLTTMSKPTISQSMVIFKQPGIGGEVKPHQDSSFLFLEPTCQSVLGFWIPLDEANAVNGCLQFWPGSHLNSNSKPYKRFIKNLDHNSKELYLYTGDEIPSNPDRFISAPVKPGDLVLIDGLVIHKSDPNTSKLPRKAYTFHIIEGDYVWSKENWLQPTSENTFISIKDFLKNK